MPRLLECTTRVRLEIVYQLRRIWIADHPHDQMYVIGHYRAGQQLPAARTSGLLELVADDAGLFACQPNRLAD
jgi:hypothetical protein